MTLRRIGITLGDINGVGPEVALKAAHYRWPTGTRIILVGSAEIVRHTCHFLDYPLPTIWRPGTTLQRKITIWDPAPKLRPNLQPGKIAVDAAQAAHTWICAAAQACLANQLDAMVTGPICKAGFQAAGFSIPGHTELLADVTQAKNVAMMLFGGGLRVVLLTRHLPLRHVADAIDAASLCKVVQLTSEALPWLGCETGKIAVCGLNPHAGENGALGTEDQTVLAPTVRRLQRAGHNVYGPIPGDTVFYSALQGEFDAVIAMYHDQGLAPLKTIAFDEGVNVTLGLPLVRTSPDHGTAFTIAGHGQASASSMVAAVRTAHQLSGVKNPWRRP